MTLRGFQEYTTSCPL